VTYPDGESPSLPRQNAPQGRPPVREQDHKVAPEAERTLARSWGRMTPEKPGPLGRWLLPCGLRGEIWEQERKTTIPSQPDEIS
jgi:hypothetical protein